MARAIRAPISHRTERLSLDRIQVPEVENIPDVTPLTDVVTSIEETKHALYNADSRNLEQLHSESVNLILTSPPYPMVEMWDELFNEWDPKIAECLAGFDANRVFELMHTQLDKVWSECFRVLKEGGILLINIGDATRSLGGDFRLFSNHSRILQFCSSFDLKILPDILWRKQTNSPTKFMGSGMLPVGAYVTYEHEYILILRKGRLRQYSKAEAEQRRASAYFWEERNKWFSDIWELKGERQIVKDIDASRSRTAAFPLEFAYRLINMFSIKGDIVLDPFVGTGTTSVAAVLSGRNSIGYDVDQRILESARKRLLGARDISSKLLQNRIQNHIDFVSERVKEGKELTYVNEIYGFPVMTSQERKLQFESIESMSLGGDLSVIARYKAFV